MEIWLDSKVNDEDVDMFSCNEYTVEPYYSVYEKSEYYNHNDSDTKSKLVSDNIDDPELEKYNDHLFIYPNTNRYHANMLFRQIIDFSLLNELYIFDNTESMINISDVIDKDSFYDFCYKNS
jgi:hypothetical protein